MDLNEGIDLIFQRLKNGELLDFLMKSRDSQTSEIFGEILNVQLFYDTPLDFKIIQQDVKNKQWYKKIVSEFSNGLSFLTYQKNISKTQKRKYNKILGVTSNNNHEMFIERMRDIINSSKINLTQLKFNKYYFISKKD